MMCPPRRRREGGVRRAIAWTAACACLTAGCSRGADQAPAQAAPAASAAATLPAGGAVPHGDHNPHHGGLVLMNGDEHFEVVLGRGGHHQVFFSDAVRAELPAATASSVTVTVTRPGREPEPIALHIDDSGESWVGSGRPIEGADATVRVAYTAHGKPYFIDVPVPK